MSQYVSIIIIYCSIVLIVDYLYVHILYVTILCTIHVCIHSLHNILGFDALHSCVLHVFVHMQTITSGSVVMVQ